MLRSVLNSVKNVLQKGRDKVLLISSGNAALDSGDGYRDDRSLGHGLEKVQETDWTVNGI